MFQGAPPGRAFEVGKRLCGDQDRNSKVDVWRPLDRQLSREKAPRSA